MIKEYRRFAPYRLRDSDVSMPYYPICRPNQINDGPHRQRLWLWFQYQLQPVCRRRKVQATMAVIIQELKEFEQLHVMGFKHVPEGIDADRIKTCNQTEKEIQIPAELRQ
jgi:hypothetical protein